MRYFFEALFARAKIPGLTWLPVKFTFLMLFAALGVFLSPWWFAAMALPLMLTVALASDERFRLTVDADAAKEQGASEADAQRQSLVTQLSYQNKNRLRDLERKIEQITLTYKRSEHAEYLLDVNSEALNKLAWMYLKLLVARNAIEASQGASEVALNDQAAAIEKEIQEGKLSEGARDSKYETLRILRKRIDNLAHREELLKEVDADLTTVEAQVDFARENASMRGRTEPITAQLQLATQQLDSEIYGDASNTIKELDKLFQAEGSVPTADPAAKAVRPPDRVR